MNQCRGVVQYSAWGTFGSNFVHCNTRVSISFVFFRAYRSPSASEMSWYNISLYKQAKYTDIYLFARYISHFSAFSSSFSSHEICTNMLINAPIPHSTQLFSFLCASIVTGERFQGAVNTSEQVCRADLWALMLLFSAFSI